MDVRLFIAFVVLLLVGLAAKLLHRRWHRKYRDALADSSLAVSTGLKRTCEILGVGTAVGSASLGVIGGLLAYPFVWQQITPFMVSVGIGLAAIALGLWRLLKLVVDKGRLPGILLGFPAWWRMTLLAGTFAAVTIAAAGSISVANCAEQRAAVWKALGVPMPAESGSVDGSGGRTSMQPSAGERPAGDETRGTCD